MWLLGSVIIKIETLTSMNGDASRPCLLRNVYFWLLTFNIFSKWYFITKSGTSAPYTLSAVQYFRLLGW